MSFNTQARAQFQRLTETGEVPVTGQPGSFAINIADQKLWTFNLVGSPVRLTRSIMAHDPAVAYGVGDIVLTGDTLWIALIDINPKPFASADWLRIGATSTSTIPEPTVSGIYNGGVISNPGGNTINVTSGSGLVVDVTAPATPDSTLVQWDALSGAINSNGSVVRAITISAAGNLGSVDVNQLGTIARSRIVLGFAYYNAAGSITRVQNTPMVPAQTAQSVVDMVRAFGGPFRTEGGFITAGAGRTIDISTGESFGLNTRWRSATDAPNFIQIPPGAGVAFDVIRQDGEVVDSGATEVPNILFQGGTVPAGFATIHYVFATPNRSGIWVQLGQQLFPSVNTAISSLTEDWEAFVTPFTRNTQTIVLGAVVVVRDATDLSDPDQGAVISTTVGPRTTQQFDVRSASTEFLRLNGSVPMEGPLDMNFNPINRAVIDEGIF